MKFSIATSLQGKRGLVVGIANDASIAAGCARAFVAAGAELAATYLNDKALRMSALLPIPLAASCCCHAMCESPVS
jgi:enoyl-[acyl-carrier protein] reductase I